MDVRRMLVSLIALAAHPACAAPFVAGEPQPISVRVAASRAAVIVRPAGVDPQAGWTIVSVLHDATGKVRAETVVRPRPAPPAGTRSALLISKADATVEAVALCADSAGYLRTLPAPDAAVTERLTHSLAHLGSADEVVAEDAFAEATRFEDADFERHRSLLPRDRLRVLVDDPDGPADRIGLYGYLLGLCGDETDARRLRRRLLAADGFATGADGLAAGYLLLTGEDGLANLEATVLTRSDTSPLLAAAVFEAFSFFRTEQPGRFRPDRLRRAACSGLTRPDTADLAVGYLAAGREWAALPDVIALIEAEDENADRRRAAQVTAVRFLQECRRDADAPAAVRTAASQALSHIATNDGDLVRRATILSGGADGRR